MERLMGKAKRGSLTADMAREFVSEIFEISSGEKLLFYSVEKWLADWLETKAASKTKTTMSSYRVAVAGFLAHLGARRGINLELLTSHDVTTYRDALVRTKRSPQTANGYVKILRMPFDVARKKGLIASNPAEGFDPLTSDKVERSAFTAEQVGSIVAAAESAGLCEWVGAIYFGFYTGQRLSDIANLRWENIELAASFPHLRLTQRKTRRTVVVPLAPTLSAWLLAQPASDDPRTFLFPSLAGRGTGGDGGLSTRFSAIMGKAGFAEDLARGAEGGRKLAARSFHSLRHTFTSIMANEGVAEEIRQKLTGHASAEVHRSYTHHELGTLRKAVDVLPALGAVRPSKKRAK